jgi:hypothetical protein
MTRVDYTGRRKGMLEAKYFVAMNKFGSAVWHFDCDCGGCREVPPRDIFRERHAGGAVDCGCKSRGKPRQQYFDPDVDKMVKKVLSPGMVSRRVYIDGKLSLYEVNKYV